MKPCTLTITLTNPMGTSLRTELELNAADGSHALGLYQRLIDLARDAVPIADVRSVAEGQWVLVDELRRALKATAEGWAQCREQRDDLMQRYAP